MVYPVSQSLIDKYTSQPLHVFKETAEVYSTITKTLFIDQIPASSVQWVYNMIDKKKETELTVFRNELFTL